MNRWAQSSTPEAPTVEAEIPANRSSETRPQPQNFRCLVPDLRLRRRIASSAGSRDLVPPDRARHPLRTQRREGSRASQLIRPYRARTPAPIALRGVEGRLRSLPGRRRTKYAALRAVPEIRANDSAD